MRAKKPESAELALTGGHLAVSKVSEALPERLETLILQAATADDALRAVRKNAADLRCCRDAWPDVQRLTARMEEGAVLKEMEPLLILFGPPFKDADEESEAGNRRWISIYTQAFAKVGMTQEALAEAVSQWIARGKPFNPQPSELIKLGDVITRRQQSLAYRMRKIHEAALAAEKPKTSKEECQEVANGLKDLANLLKPKGMPLGPQRPVGNQHAMAERIRREAGTTA